MINFTSLCQKLWVLKITRAGGCFVSKVMIGRPLAAFQRYDCRVIKYLAPAVIKFSTNLPLPKLLITVSLGLEEWSTNILKFFTSIKQCCVLHVCLWRFWHSIIKYKHSKQINYLHSSVFYIHGCDGFGLEEIRTNIANK